MSLVELVHLLRGQTPDDMRPNKALNPEVLTVLYDGYVHRDVLVSIAQNGFTTTLGECSPAQPEAPPMHFSAQQHLPAVVLALQKGQAAGQYLLLDSDVLPHLGPVQCSPLAVVPKKNTITHSGGRVIHNLSFGRPKSVNDQTLDGDLPTVAWPSVRAVANRINELRRSRHPGTRIRGKCGDVQSAYRHLGGHAAMVKWFGTCIELLGLLAFDLSAPFGWKGSPFFYTAVGNGISWLVAQQSPFRLNPSMCTDDDPFWGFNWVDDHILIELDLPHRLANADIALRLSMLATLGSRIHQ